MGEARVETCHGIDVQSGDYKNLFYSTDAVRDTRRYHYTPAYIMRPEGVSTTFRAHLIFAVDHG